MPSRKRREPGEGSVSRNTRGLWVARVELPPTYDVDGKPKRRRLEKTSTRQRVVLDWLAETKRELARTGAVADAQITVASWAERWLAIRQTQVKPGSMKIYRSVISNWVLPTIGQRKLARVRPSDIRAVTDAMRAAGKAATTMHNAHGMLSAMFAAAVRDGIIFDNPAKKIDAPAAGPRHRGAFTVEQLARVVAAERDRGSCRFTVQLFTGMRQGEALGLTWDAVDLDAGQLTVLWQLQSLPRRHGCGLADDAPACGYRLGAYCPKGVVSLPDGMPSVHLHSSQYLVPPKSGKVRTVPLLPQVVDALRTHHARTADEPNPCGLVFHRPDGVPLRPDDDQHAWKGLMAEAGLPVDVTTHWARHTVATLMMEAGIDAKVVGEIVGHSSVRITRDVYQHTSSALARDAMRRFGELVASA